MSLLQRLFERAGYYRASRINDLLASEWQYADGIGPDIPPADENVSYNTSVWVYRCASIWAQNVAQVPVRFYREGTRNGKPTSIEVPTNPAAALLDYVNGWYSPTRLWMLTYLDLAITGDCFWGLERNGSGNIAEIWRLHPRRVKVLPSKTDYIAGYEYEVNNIKTRYAPEDVVHFLLPDPDNEYRGQAPFVAASTAIKTDLGAQRHNYSLIANHAIPRSVLTTDRQMDPRARKAAMQEWSRMFRGPAHAGRTAILHSGLSLKPVAMTPQEMDWLEQRRVSRDEILAAYGIPPLIAGVPNEAKYDTAPEQKRTFWEETMVPLLAIRDSVLNELFLPKFRGIGTIRAESDVSGVPAMQAREAEERERALVEVSAGTMTINEYREQFGRDPVTWGNVWWRPIALTPQNGAEPDAAPPAQLALPQSRAFGDPVHAAKWRAHYVAVRAFEPTVEAFWRKVFRRQEAAALRYLETIDGKALEQRDLTDQMLSAVSADETAESEALIREATQRGATTAEATYGLASAWDIGADPEMLAIVRARAAELSVFADSTTLALLRPRLAQALNEGATMNQLADIVQEVFEFSKFHRAARIAQTEVNRAAAEGSLETYRENGIERKEWLSALLPTTRPEHAEAHEEVVGIDEDFVLSDGTTMQGPGLSGVAHHDIFCKCAVAPVV